MQCPECRKSMVILEYRDIEVDFCPRCKGCWLDEGELELLLGEEYEAVASLDRSSGRKGKRPCCRCGAKMRVVTLPDTKTEIDICPENCGLWLDDGELQAITSAQASAGRAGDIAQFLSEIFGNETSTQ